MFPKSPPSSHVLKTTSPSFAWGVGESSRPLELPPQPVRQGGSSLLSLCAKEEPWVTCPRGLSWDWKLGLGRAKDFFDLLLSHRKSASPGFEVKGVTCSFDHSFIKYVFNINIGTCCGPGTIQAAVYKDQPIRPLSHGAHALVQS